MRTGDAMSGSERETMFRKLSSVKVSIELAQAECREGGVVEDLTRYLKGAAVDVKEADKFLTFVVAERRNLPVSGSD